MKALRRAWFLLPVVLLLGFVAACKVSPSHNFTVAGKDFSFVMPDAVPSGVD